MSTLRPLPLAYLLRRFRLAAGLSQEALAERAGLSTRAISDLERGLRTAPRPDTMRALTDALSLSDEQHDELMQAARPDIWRYPEAGNGNGNGNGNGHGQWDQGQIHRPRRRSLPIPPTQLIGRDDAVVRIGALLDGQDVRLITLVGPGGVGKTRLAIAVAEQAATDFADGVVFVDLARIREPTLVAHAIAEALGITSVAMRPMVETLSLALEQRSILLVVDNFEHILDGATVVSDLMGACPNLEFVVTSRERLHLRGEHVVPVIPLELPPDASEWADVELEDIARTPAVQLFVSRAQEAGFGFELTADNAQAVSEICRRLDGLPLALELAASRIRLLDPDALLTRLDRKLSTLTEGARDAPSRHQTMRDTIAWSYGLLSDDEQTLFRRLAVFSGGFSLPAAATVAPESYDIGDDPWAGLYSLVEKSLVNEAPGPLGRPRFSMLEVIREFALDRLNAAQEEDETRRAHAQWFHDLAVEAEGDLRFGLNQFAWFPEIDHELGNLRAAMSWYRSVGDGARLIRIATALDEYWFSHSLYREFMYWLKAGRALDPELDPVVDGWARCLESSATRLLGDIPASQRAIAEAFIVAESCGDLFLRGRALLGSALLAQLENDYQRKLVLCQEAVPCFQAVGAMNYLALMLVEIGSAYQQLGDSANAAASIDQGIALMRTTGDDWALGMTTGIRGDLSLAEADHLLAAQMYRESIQLSRQTNDERTVLFAVNGLARLALQLGEAGRATRLLSAAMARRNNWADAPATTSHLFDDAVASAESALGTDAFRHEWAIGSAESFETTLADALAFADEVIGPEPDA
ncbi:MAG: helix-turn-helix domain-containing protein [Thermomicrobiales bacterium]